MIKTTFSAIIDHLMYKNSLTNASNTDFGRLFSVLLGGPTLSDCWMQVEDKINRLLGLGI